MGCKGPAAVWTKLIRKRAEPREGALPGLSAGSEVSIFGATLRFKTPHRSLGGGDDEAYDSDGHRPGPSGELETSPERFRNLAGNWQALDSIGMYFYLSWRRVNIPVDVPDEDRFYEAPHATRVVRLPCGVAGC